MIELFTAEEYDAVKSTKKLPLQCEKCGNTFYIEKKYITATYKGTKRSRLKYCSVLCASKSKDVRVDIHCEQCGKYFKKQRKEYLNTKHHFCTQSCAATYTNTHKTKGTRISKIEIWIEEQLRSLFPNLEIHFNKKDAIQSELDIYIPSLKLAFEINGIHHYKDIFKKNYPNKFPNIVANDARKVVACKDAGIVLYVINTSKQGKFTIESSKKYLNKILNVLKKYT